MKKCLPGFLFGILLFNNLYSQNQWNLKQAIDYAIANNITVKQANLASRQAELDYNVNRVGVYPSASFNNNWNMSFGRRENPVTGIFENTTALSSSFGFNSSFLIFNFYSQRNAVQAAMYQRSATEATEDKAKNDIALRVANAFLLALQAKEQLNLNELQIRLTQEQLNVTRKRVDAGALPELNAAEIEAQLARDSSTYVSSVANRELQLLQLKAILNLDAGVPFDIVTPPIDQIPLEPILELQPEAVYASALANLPQQRINEFRLKAAEKNVLSARGAMYPAIGGFAGLSTNFFSPLQRTIPGTIPGPDELTGLFVRNGVTVLPVFSPTFDGSNTVNKSFGQVWNGFGSQLKRNFGQGIGISLSVPLFNRYQARGAWERSKLNLRNVELQKELDNQTLKQDIYNAYNNAVAALQQNNASLKAVETAQRAYDLARKRYDVNLLSTFELITSQNNLFRAQINLLLSRYNYVFTMKVLEFYKGQGLKL
jgi:outer membrane protein